MRMDRRRRAGGRGANGAARERVRDGLGWELYFSGRAARLEE
jgi:hypothetical protein